MPPPPRKGKEPKETVIYPSSKRKAPPFKPLRPSKLQRVESDTSITATATTSRPPSKPAAARKAPPFKPVSTIPKDVENDSSKTLSSASDDDDDDLLNLTTNPPVRRKASITAPRDNSPLYISSNELPATTAGATDNDPLPSQSDSIPSIPQPLLLRLLHEAFVDKTTKIDTHAIQVLQKYLEIFVREAIARAKHAKLEASGGEDTSELGGTWLELEDLERVAPGLLCDF